MNAVEEFSKRSTTSYLQSVVFVDDRIYAASKPLEISSLSAINASLQPVPKFTASSEADPVDSDDSGSNLKGVTTAQKTEPNAVTVGGAATSDKDDPNQNSEYHPRELMESFAKSGIICALYEPKKGFKTSVGSELYQLCERADVVILDWDLHKDDGDGVTALLAELIKTSEAIFPHHIRLCAVYTDKPNLQSVMNSLYEKLKIRKCEVDTDGKQLRLVAGATRISIFGKPGSIGRSEEFLPYEVKEEMLADRMIDEFASLHAGILPAFALHGLAAIRRNTKRLLDKFRCEMDGSFLMHRALTKGDEDAFELLPELLADEIRAVLEDTWLENVDLDRIASDRINALPIGEPQSPWKAEGSEQTFEAKGVFREFLLKGEDGLVAASKTCKNLDHFKKGKGFRGISPKILKDFESMLKLQGKGWAEELAALFCNRTQYGNAERILRFGTVVRHKKADTEAWLYSVCLMPICDSQRLTKPTTFPFWRLKDDAKSGNTGKRNGVVVIDPEGIPRCLAAGGKIRDMFWLADFTPSESHCVVAVKSEKGFCLSSSGQIIEWIGELKPLHAQRIAAYMGQEISRVGLVESEWLRLFCDR